ncbi:MAG: acetate/propionate family kinase [Clostridia bacterium]|nr:acetate/propionate family kinase [Clostridia bacterium]
MKILVSNVGSTSLKFKLYEMPSEHTLCTARIESVGSTTDAVFTYSNLLNGKSTRMAKVAVPDYTSGINQFLACLTSEKLGVVSDVSTIAAVGFKTVLAKGYLGVHELTEEVMQGMRDYLFVAPAHNGPYLEAIEAFRPLLPRARMIGVFETAFHTTIPLERRMYAIPYEWYQKYGVMRMGYHGASHGYIARTIAARCGSAGKVISCHLGGSCSVCAIENGVSVDTSFGFSLQTGLPHAARAGDTDSYIVPFLLNEGLSMDEIMLGLGKKGGLLGVSGVSSDLRRVQEAAAEGDGRAKLAVDVFVSAVIRYIGAFYAELGGLDHLVFTGGIGENSADIRAAVCDKLVHMGIELDAGRNRSLQDEGVVSKEGSPVEILVIPANEEIGIAREVCDYIGGR